MSSARAGVVARLGVTQTLAWASSYYLPAVLADSIARDLGLATAWIFGAFSLGLLVSGFCGPLSGRLVDRHGGHRVLPASNLLFAAGLSALALATGQASLIASWLVLGTAMSCGLYETAFSSLARLYGQDARRAITGITLFAGFASTVGWPLTAWLDAAFGWRAACLCWAAAHLLICLPLNFGLPSTRRAPPTTDAQSAPVTRIPRRWTMAALAFVFAGTWFGSTSMAAHLPRLLQESGASLPAAVAAASLIGPAQVAARLLEFWLARHASPLLSARLASLAHPLGAGVLITAGAPAAAVFTIAHGAGNGVMTIANGTLPLHLFGAHGYGARQGLLMMPARILQAGAPMIFEALLSRLGPSALLVTSGLGLASFIVLTALSLAGPRAVTRA